MKTREELIQDYLDGVLAVEDKDRFSDLLQQDVNFQKDLKIQQDLRATLKRRLSPDVEELRMHLKNAEAIQRNSKAATANMKRWTPYLVAACILIAGVLFFLPQQEDLYTLPEMRSEIVRGEMTGEGPNYEDAVLAFNQKQYAESSKVLRILTNEHPDILQYQFYLGLSLLGETKFDEAATSLKPLSSGNSVFKNEATYYLSIAFHELGKTKEALSLLKTIPSDAPIYEESQKLLSQLNKQS